jgi:hypothetical protein
MRQYQLITQAVKAVVPQYLPKVIDTYTIPYFEHISIPYKSLLCLLDDNK